ncbi:hypothetical protein GCM10028806_34260 [Spirosoma terrae]|uniref:Uncharacterized protein n=1 Tax=Spirosoma terrae TaxID=1968276 RepID=A0A6L9LGH0_9BACT|nr:hypothetical protein [Spirosoma terrae]NDU95739.1 hypothetical protein [Spirosoma terrae]
MNNQSPCTTPQPPPAPDCRAVGPFDSSRITYHCNTNIPSKLRCLGIKNGTSLERILEKIDDRLCSMQMGQLCCLTKSYKISSWADFAQAVDTELCLIKQAPLKVKDCPDKLIKLTIDNGEIMACLDVAALVDLISKNPAYIDKITKPVAEPDVSTLEVYC